MDPPQRPRRAARRKNRYNSSEYEVEPEFNDSEDPELSSQSSSYEDSDEEEYAPRSSSKARGHSETPIRKTAVRRVLKKNPDEEEEGRESSDEEAQPVPQKTKWECDNCGTYWATKDQWHRHQQTHTSRFAATCNFCDRIIRHRFNLKAHLMKCREKALAKDKTTGIAHLYPEFAAGVVAASTDLTVDWPKLPSGFKMDKNGLISGYDPKLSTGVAMMMKKK
uniref:C2H2-type domain-containing protein n=1 Tax=Caenorhabditis tropicalis TaxID=1561998 RepID=A0A1I7TA46_9PELO